jgi:transcriptional repressor NrdR
VKCPFCGVLDNRVIDSRLSHAGEVTRRRRECEGCSRRYTTYERVEQLTPMVVKRDGTRQPFDRMKVLAGAQRAVIKLEVPAERLEHLVDRVEREIVESGEREVDSAYIGEKVLDGLRELDRVAYVRFASVHRKFRDLDEFVAELSRLRSPKRAPARPSADAPVDDDVEALEE